MSFSKKTHKKVKTLARPMKIKRENSQVTNGRHEKGNITTNLVDIKRMRLLCH